MPSLENIDSGVNTKKHVNYDEFIRAYADTKTESGIKRTREMSRDLVDALHKGGTLCHFWTSNGRKSGNGKETLWMPVSATGFLPMHWMDASPKKSVYFSINTSSVAITDEDRKKDYLQGRSDSYIQTYTRGKNNHIDAVNCLFADFDGKDFADPDTAMIEIEYNNLRALPQHEHAKEKSLWNMAVKAAKEVVYAADMGKYNRMAFDHVRSLPLQPSVFWFSGGGFQGVWLLSETIATVDVEMLNLAKSLQRRWTMFVDGDQAAKDLARVLRLPGSFNAKKIYPEPQLVSYVEYDLGTVYTIDQLVEVLPVESDDKPKKQRAKKQFDVPAHISVPDDSSSDIDLDYDTLSPYAVRVMCDFNRTNSVKDLLVQFGYEVGSGGKLRRPGGKSDSVKVFDNNRSWHNSSSDLLYTDLGSRPRSPFDVVAAFAFGGDYEDAAESIGRQIGILRWDDLEDFINRHRNLVLNADWSNIIPIERQSKRGYRTGSTDRMLYDNVLDYARKAGRIKGLNLSLRTITEVINPDGVKVAVADHSTAKTFLERVNGVLIDCTINAPKFDKDGDFAVSRSHTINKLGEIDHSVGSNDDKRKPGSIDLIDFAVSRSHTINKLGEIDHSVGSNDDKTGEVQFSLGGLKGDDVFARGTSRFQKKQANLTTFGDDDRTLETALDEMLPGLGFNGLLVTIDMLENPGTTKAEIAQRRGLKTSAVGVVLRKLEDWDVIEYEQEAPRTPKVYTIADDVFAQFSERIANTRTFKIGAQRLEKRLEQMQTNAEMDAYAAAINQDGAAMAVAEKRANRAVARRFMALAAIYPHWTEDELSKYIYSPKLTLKPWLDTIDQRKDAEIRVAEKELDRKRIMQTVNDLKELGVKGRDAYRMAETAGYTPMEAARIAKMTKGYASM